MPDYSNVDAAIAAARGASNRTAFYNQNMQARRANTSSKYVSRNAAALAARQKAKAKGTDMGGWKGVMADVMESPVGAALKTLDVPRSYVASHVSDIAQELEQGDWGGAVGALGRGVGLGVVGEIADAAQGKGFDVAGILNSYENERNRKDFWAHTGVGTYLQRGLDKHTWDDDTILNNRGVKIAIGLAGDIGLDPISWSTGGIKGGAQATGRAILERAGVLTAEAGEKAAQAAAARGASAAEQAIARAAAEGVARGTETAAAREAIATVGKYGASGLSGEQAVKYFPNVHHGWGFGVPFTGRVGKSLGYKGSRKVIPFLPRSVTNPIVRKLAIPRNALRASEFGGKLGTKFAGATPQSYELLRSGDPSKAWQGIELRTAVRKGNAYNAAGLRLLEDNSFAAVEGGTKEGVGRLGRRASDVLHREVVKKLKLTSDELKTARNAVESISDPAELVKIKGATELKSFLHEMYRVAEREGVPIQELDNYFPRILTDEWKQARGYAQGSGVGTGRPASTRARTILPEAGETNATIRENMNRLAQDTGIDVGFYEDDVLKTLDEYIKGMTNAVARRRVIGHLRDTGILLDDEAMPFAFKLKQQSNFAKVRQGIDKTLAGLKSDVDAANQTAAEAEARAATAASDVSSVVAEQTAARDRAFNSVLEELQLQGRTPIRPADIDVGNEIVNRAVNSGQIDVRILDHLTSDQLDNAVAEWSALTASGSETRAFGSWLNTRFTQWEQGRIPQPRPMGGVKMSPEGEILSRAGRRGPRPRVRGGAHMVGPVNDEANRILRKRILASRPMPPVEQSVLDANRAAAVAAADAEISRLFSAKTAIDNQIAELEAKLKEFPNASSAAKGKARERLAALRAQRREIEQASSRAGNLRARAAGTDFGSQFDNAAQRTGSEAGGDIDIADAAQAGIEWNEQAGIQAALQPIEETSRAIPSDIKGTTIDRYTPPPTGDAQLDIIWRSRAERHQFSEGAGIRGGRNDAGVRAVVNIEGSREAGPSAILDLFPDATSPSGYRQYASRAYLNKLAGEGDETAKQILDDVRGYWKPSKKEGGKPTFVPLTGVSARSDELFEEGMSIYAHAVQVGDEEAMRTAQNYIAKGQKHAADWLEIQKAARSEANKAARAARAAEIEVRKEQLLERFKAGEITEREYNIILRSLEKQEAKSVPRLTDTEQRVVELKRELSAMTPKEAGKYLRTLVNKGKLSTGEAGLLERQYLRELDDLNPAVLSKLKYSEAGAKRLASIGTQTTTSEAVAELAMGPTKYGSLGADAYTPAVIAETYDDIAKFRQAVAAEKRASARYLEMARTDPEHIAKLDEYVRQMQDLGDMDSARQFLLNLRKNGDVSLDDLAMMQGRFQEVFPEVDIMLGNMIDTEFRSRAQMLTREINALEHAVEVGDLTPQQALTRMTETPSPSGNGTLLEDWRQLQHTFAERMDLHFGFTRNDYTSDISNLQEAVMAFDYTPKNAKKAVSVWQGPTADATKKIKAILTQFGELRGYKTKELFALFFNDTLPRIESLGGRLRPDVVDLLTKRANKFRLETGSVQEVMETLDMLRAARVELDQKAMRLNIVPRIRGDKAVEGSLSATEVARRVAYERETQLDIVREYVTSKPYVSFDELEQRVNEMVLEQYRQADAAAGPNTKKLLNKDGTLSARGVREEPKTFQNIYNQLRNEESRGFLNVSRISHNDLAATKGIEGLFEPVERRPLGWGNHHVTGTREQSEVGLFRTALRGSEPKPIVKAPPSPAVAEAVAAAPPEVAEYMEAIYVLSESNPAILDDVEAVLTDVKHITNGKLNAKGKKALAALVTKERGSLIADDAARELDLVDEAAGIAEPAPAAVVDEVGDLDATSRIKRIKELSSVDSGLVSRAQAVLEDPKYYDPETGLTKAGAKKLDGMIKFAESKTPKAAPVAATPVESVDPVLESIAEEAGQQVEQRVSKAASRSAKNAKAAERAKSIDVNAFEERIKAAGAVDSGLGKRVRAVLEDPKFRDAEGVLSERGVVKIDNMIKNAEEKIASGKVAKAPKSAAPAETVAPAVEPVAPTPAAAGSEVAFGPLWDDPAVAAERRAAMAASPEAQAQVDAILLDPANKTQKGALRRSARSELNSLYRQVVGAPEGAVSPAAAIDEVTPPVVQEIAPSAPVAPEAASGVPAPRTVPFESKIVGSQKAWNDPAEVQRRMGMLTQRQQKQLARILTNPQYQTSKGFSRSGVTAANRAWAGFAKNAPKAGAVDVGTATSRIVADQQANVAREAEELATAAGGGAGGAVPPSKPPTGGTGDIPPDPFEAANNARLNATKKALGVEVPETPMSANDAFASHVEGLSDPNPATATASSDNLFADAIGTALDARSSAKRIRETLLDRNEFTNVLDEQIEFVKTQGRGSAEVISSLEKARAVSAQADELIAAARQTTHEAGRAALVHVAEARRAEAQFIASSKFYDNIVEAAERNLKLTPTQERIREAIANGTYQELASNPNLYAPREVAEALNRVGKVTTPEGFKKFLKHYDTLVGWLKRWQVATPGFHLRNYLGGTFNNYLADVEIGSVAKFRKAYKSWQAGTLSAEESQNMARLLEYLGGGQYGNVELGNKFGMSAKPWASDFAPIQASAKAGENVEFYLRGGLGWDRLLKGQTIDTAIDDIVRYHFDYADLSAFERGTVKRFIPFYTWTRYNLPLQMEMIATNPSKYTKYYIAKNEIEALSDPEKVVPSYIANDLFGIRTPWGETGQRLYITPDLPFTQTVASSLPDFKNFNPKRAKSYSSLADNYLSMMTPVVKTPLEFMKGEQFFKGIPLPRDRKNMDTPWGFNNALGNALSEFAGGQGRAAYAVEQIAPPYARARRLFPSEEKYQQRRGASVAAFFGLPLRTNTESDIESEILRRRFAAAAAKKDKKK